MKNMSVARSDSWSSLKLLVDHQRDIQVCSPGPGSLGTGFTNLKARPKGSSEFKYGDTGSSEAQVTVS